MTSPGRQSGRRSRPQEFLFPPSERLLKVEKRGADIRLEPTGEVPPQVLFGLRPCDARGIRIQDAAFLETPPADRAYALRREKTTTVGLACRSMGASCFCTAVGLGGGCARCGLDAHRSRRYVRGAGDESGPRS
jgi:hypothetical protein